jgi:protein O-mannosyl-transferase
MSKSECRTTNARSFVIRHSSFLPAAVCGLLVLSVIAVFGQTARHDFINLDDDDYVYENPHIQAGLTAAGIAWAFSNRDVSAQWQPVTLLSLMADVQSLASGEGPPDRLGDRRDDRLDDRARLAARIHVTNVALHAVNSILLFLLLRAMTGSQWRSAFAAALFAVHPLHVESVAWVSERKDVLSGLFGLLALWAYVVYARGPHVVPYLCVVVALALGLMAKPMLVTWPFLFLLLDYWPLRRQGATQSVLGREQGERGLLPAPHSLLPAPAGRRDLHWLILEKLPLLLLVGISAAIAYFAQLSGGTVISLRTAPVYQRIARAAVIYVEYLGKMFWPANLSAVYSAQDVAGFWPASAAVALLVFVTITVVWRARRGEPWLATGWFWYLGTLLPVIGLVQVGSAVVADRFVYLPQIGISIALAWAVADLAKFQISNLRSQISNVKFRTSHVIRRSVAYCSLVALSSLTLSALAVCAWRQTCHWRDSEALWNHALTCNPRNASAHLYLGMVFAVRRQSDESIAQYRLALSINPKLEQAEYNLGAALGARGQVDEAHDCYVKALEIRPGDKMAHNNLGLILAARGQADAAAVHYRAALQSDPNFVEARYNLGMLLTHHGQLDEAIAQFEQILKSDPDNALPHFGLAEPLARRGNIERALAEVRRAIEIKPDFAEAHNGLGVILAGQGRSDEAVAEFRKALDSRPDMVDAYFNLGLAAASSGNLDQAIALYRKAVELQPGNAYGHVTLGLVLARRGLIDEAIAQYREALRTQPGNSDTHIYLGRALAGGGHLDEAVVQYREALASRPDDEDAQNGLGTMLAGQGHLDEAIPHFRKALEIKPDYLEARFNLGLALAGSGRAGEALEHYQKALELAAAGNDKSMVEAIRARIARLKATVPKGTK